MLWCLRWYCLQNRALDRRHLPGRASFSPIQSSRSVGLLSIVPCASSTGACTTAPCMHAASLMNVSMRPHHRTDHFSTLFKPLFRNTGAICRESCWHGCMLARVQLLCSQAPCPQFPLLRTPQTQQAAGCTSMYTSRARENQPFLRCPCVVRSTDPTGLPRVGPLPHPPDARGAPPQSSPPPHLAKTMLPLSSHACTVLRLHLRHSCQSLMH